MRLIASVLLLAACTGGPTITPPAPDVVVPAAPASEGAFGSYTLRFPEPETQYLEVELVLPQAPADLQLRMASWTPGSYAIRDYAQHVDRVTVTDAAGSAVTVDKVAKDIWAVAGAAESSELVVRYRLYASELGVRSNWVEPDFAVLNGAPTYLVPVGHESATYDVRIEQPDAWPDLSTALPPHPSGDDNRFRVANYELLVDSPIVLGDSEISTWTVPDPARPDRIVRHRLVHDGDTAAWDVQRSRSDVDRLSREIIAFWGGIPYADYTFLNMVTDTGGGLEHKASTLMMARRWATHERDSRIKWLGLVSHEFFHTWNVKRLRPEGLGPFDLSAETYTPSLWIAEGLTSYYDDVLVRRAGLMTDDEYLAKLSDNIRGLQARPGRFNRSVEQASEDAWIKYYQRDENHDNVSVSYYTKGSVVGWVLDAEIRDRSGGWRTLDDALRLAYSRHSGERGYTAAEFQAACEEVAGGPMEDFFSRYVRGTDELDYTTALRVFGLRFAEPPTDKTDEPVKAKTWLGVDASSGPSAQVRRIIKDSPAWQADVIPGDEVIAVGGYRVSGSIQSLIDHFDVGDEVVLTLSRRGQLRTTRVVLAEQPDTERWTLQVDPESSIEARETRKQWSISKVAEADIDPEEPAPAAQPESP